MSEAPDSWPIIGKHTGDLFREDAPSLYLPSAEPWYTPRHSADDRCPECGGSARYPRKFGCSMPHFKFTRSET